MSAHVELIAVKDGNSKHAKTLRLIGPEGTKFPTQGDFKDLGLSGLVQTIQFCPSHEGPLACVIEGEVPPNQRFIQAAKCGRVTLGWAPNGAVLRIRTGYKARHESHVKVTEGVLIPSDRPKDRWF